MLRKEEILERTNNGLSVFKHYISGNWRIGHNFLNPLYEDNKASCNIYFDRRSGIYKMKDFGNDSYSGDCFFFVGQLKGLDCNNSMDFVEILETIDRDWQQVTRYLLPVILAVWWIIYWKKHLKKKVSLISSGNRNFSLPN